MIRRGMNTKLRAQWMRDFEQHLVGLVPALAGKVDWDTAIFLCNRGNTATDAAVIAAKRHQEESTDE